MICLKITSNQMIALCEMAYAGGAVCAKQMLQMALSEAKVSVAASDLFQ